MSQKVAIVCDRCGTVMEGSVDEGAAPHWSLAFHSTDRKVKRGGKTFYGFDGLSWDLCEPCAREVAGSLRDACGLKPSGKDWQQAAVERLLA